MQKQFESNIIKNQLFTKKENLLLAISGGVDSVVLARLLKKGKYNFSLAHCNFQLRGKDSEADEKFCKELAEELEVEIFIKRFDTKKFSKDQKQSTQMAARTLRYGYFYELLEEHQFDHIVTAHHANDVVETVLINLIRGTGIQGLLGVPLKNLSTVRPLLFFSKEEILKFARKEKILFREDKSNQEDKYERNFLRLKVIPLLRQINPSLETTFIKNTLNFRKDALIVKDFLGHKMNDLVSYKNGTVSIDKHRLKKEIHLESILHFITSDYGFNETQRNNIISNLTNDADRGKKFISATHRLTIERDGLLIVPKAAAKTEEIKINSLHDLEKNRIAVAEIGKFELPSKKELVVAAGKLKFPLTIRSRRTGDKFIPFGMKGFKLLSDFIKDEKLNSVEKENLKVLVNGNGDIIWLMGYRSDDRFRVGTGENKLLKFHLLE